VQVINSTITCPECGFKKEEICLKVRAFLKCSNAIAVEAGYSAYFEFPKGARQNNLENLILIKKYKIIKATDQICGIKTFTSWTS
jgi:hypothetical protein